MSLNLFFIFLETFFPYTSSPYFPYTNQTKPKASFETQKIVEKENIEEKLKEIKFEGQ